MRLIVKNVFRDKEDHVTVYEPGTILDVNDEKRAADLVKRGLCSEYKGEADASFTLGKPVAKASGKDKAAKSSKKETKEPATGADKESSPEEAQVSVTNAEATKEP